MKQIFRKNLNLLVIAILFVQFYLLSQFKFTAWPEMLGWPYLILKGLLPYRDIAIAHTPHLIFDLTLFFKIFGTGLFQLKIFTWLVILASDLMLFWTVQRMFNKKTAVLALAIFAFWQVLFEGNSLWFDLLLTPLAIALYYFVTKKRYVVAGLIWASMFLTKQTAVWFLIPFLFSVWSVKEKGRKEVISFAKGVVLVFAVFICVIFVAGILPHFYKWAIEFGVFILPKAHGQVLLPGLKSLIQALSPFVVLIPVLIKKPRKNLMLLSWVVAGSLGTYPRFELFHFQPAIPFLAIGGAIFFIKIFDSKNKLDVLFVSTYLIGSFYLSSTFFVKNWNEGTRFFEENVIAVSEYVSQNTEASDKIFVMNWWDNIYSESERLPSTIPLIPQLSWYQEIDGIQEGEVEDFINNPPEMIVLNPYTQGGLSSYIPEKLYMHVMANYKFKERISGIDILVRK